MNPVFWLLVIIGAIILWFIISFIFIPFGSLILKKWDKTIGILNKETKENNSNDEKGEK